MRIKGRYAAQVIIDIDVDAEKTNLQIDEIRKNITEGLTPALQDELQSQLDSDLKGCTVELIQQYADVWKAEEEQEE